MAAAYQAALADMAGGGGMAAKVMSADGTWGGTAGKADGVRDMRIEDQFNIGSVNKSLVAAQVMQLVEAGELDLESQPPTTSRPTSTSTPTGRRSASC